MNISASTKSLQQKSRVLGRRSLALAAATAFGVPVLGTAISALGDISITYDTVGSSQLFLPQTGTYTLEVAGAQGGSNGPIIAGGFGAIVEGTTANFTSRDSVSFYVGGQGVGTSDFTLGAGGGGGSFFYDNTTSSLLVAAGGGGGEGGGSNGGVGQTTNAGTAGASGMGDTGGTAGTGGNGGQAGTSGDGGGGGGLVSAGQTTSGFGATATGGGGFSGFAGGTTTEPGLSVVTGGYGGGGAAGIESGGGGGGYSGGGGGGGNAGGGGGSFLAASVTGTGSYAGSNSGNGFIIFSPTTFDLNIVYGATGTIAGDISGGGAVNMNGVGNAVLTSTNNSWTGGMTISAGTITIGDGGNDGSLPGNVTNNSKLVFNSSGTVTASGNISGTGTITQSGSGTTVLSGTNSSYSGIATISGGTLQLGNNGNTGIIAGNITDNAALVIDVSGQEPYNGVISGTGSFTTTGSGVVNLSKQQTYAGSTTIQNTAIVELIANALPATTNLNLTSDFQSLGGNLDLNGAATGAQTVASLSGDSGGVGLGTNGVFTVNQSINTTFGGSIDDSTQIGQASTGKLVKSGTGTLTLTGASIYAGGTTISGGSLQIGNGGPAGSVAGNFTDNANLAFDRSDSFTVSGNVAGSGSVSVLGSGTLVVTGSLSHTGGTTISGGSLQIGNGGTSGSITGNVTDNANLTFDIASGDMFYGGVISGSGSLTQAGGNALILDSASTYMGNTTVSSGFLYTSVNNALPVTTNLNLSGGLFVFNGGNLSQTVASLTGSDGIEVPAGLTNDTFTVNQTSSTTFSGGIVDGTAFSSTGSLQFVKEGSGALTLTGDSHYSGGTTISGGRVQIGDGAQSGSIFGDITDNASFIYDRSDVVTYPSVISGTGDFTQKGTGTVVFTGTNTYTGGTTINTSATLQLGNGGTTGVISNTGGILDNGNITFDRTDSFTFGGYIHGIGSVTQSGTGTVTLSTSNSYTGNTNVSAGALIISAVNGLAEGPVSITDGVLQLAPGTGEEDSTSLAVTGSSDFDITNNHVFIDYGSGPDPIASIRSYLVSGYAGGTWTGNGIMSTTAQSNVGSYGIGYADSADPGNPAHLASGQIEVMYTLLGDANLDGVVTGVDFTILIGNLGKVVNSWDQGDFNYDGLVTGVDFTSLIENLGKAANGSAIEIPASDLAAIDAFAAANGLMADVPEPTCGALAAVAAVGLFQRRRRRTQSSESVAS